MYSLRPLQAWTSFNRACSTFQTCIRARPKECSSLSRSKRSLEHRLYWSCLKSERLVTSEFVVESKCLPQYHKTSEIRMEVDVPSSGLAKVTYPDIFPTPPFGSPSPHAEDAESGFDLQNPVSSTSLDPDLERSWYYYLAEIAGRRIFNRVVNSFYKNDESTWLTTPIDVMIRIAEELDEQLTQWSKVLSLSSLPRHRSICIYLTKSSAGATTSPILSPSKKRRFPQTNLPSCF